MRTGLRTAACAPAARCRAALVPHAGHQRTTAGKWCKCQCRRSGRLPVLTLAYPVGWAGGGKAKPTGCRFFTRARTRWAPNTRKEGYLNLRARARTRWAPAHQNGWADRCSEKPPHLLSRLFGSAHQAGQSHQRPKGRGRGAFGIRPRGRIEQGISSRTRRLRVARSALRKAARAWAITKLS